MAEPWGGESPPLPYEFHCSTSSGSRLDKYLTSRLGRTSREKVQAAIREGRVSVNGQVVRKVSYSVRPGDHIVYHPLPRPPKFLPSEQPLTVLYEDNWLLVVHKPSGMAIHPGPGHKGDTLADAILGYYRKKGLPLPDHPGIVHRLDLPTSGVVLAGKDLATQQDLSRQFAERTVKKGYLALVWGIPPSPEGVIDAPMEECPYDRTRWHVSARGKEAKTFYRLKSRHGQFALLQVFPLTGRTHQIRVHLDHIGHPILGDPLYGRPNWHLRQGHISPFPAPLRLCLHAERLTVRHPRRGLTCTFLAALPSDFRHVLQGAETYRTELA